MKRETKVRQRRLSTDETQKFGSTCEQFGAHRGAAKNSARRKNMTNRVIKVILMPKDPRVLGILKDDGEGIVRELLERAHSVQLSFNIDDLELIREAVSLHSGGDIWGDAVWNQIPDGSDGNPPLLWFRRLQLIIKRDDL
jgi:hypothetical protein